jgi:hypothetical protein
VTGVDEDFLGGGEGEGKANVGESCLDARIQYNGDEVERGEGREETGGCSWGGKVGYIYDVPVRRR